jgi:hypothetical protein
MKSNSSAIRMGIPILATLLVAGAIFAIAVSARDNSRPTDALEGAARNASAALDYEQIRNLVSRYNDAAWRQDVDALANTFAADGELIYFGRTFGADGSQKAESADAQQTIKGQVELRKTLAVSLPKAQPLPFGHNHVIHLISPTEATGTVMNENMRGRDFTLNSIVYFKDKYVKVAGEWKIRRRENHVMQPGMNPDSQLVPK